MNCSSFVRSSSHATRLFIAVCSLAVLGFAVTACGNGSGGSCPEGQKKFKYPSDAEPECYVTCDEDSECEKEGEECINGVLCAKPAGQDDDAMSGDASMTDAGETGTDEDADTGGGNSCIPGDEMKTCTEVYTCRLQCTQQQGRTCIDNCIAQGHCTAQERYNAFDSCLQENDCTADDAPATCQEDNCEQEMRTCGIVGKAKCGERRRCTSKCLVKVRDQAPDNISREEERKRILKCIAQECDYATIDAQKKASKISGCSDANNCGADDAETACSFKNCDSQYQACGLLGTDQSCSMDSDCTRDSGATEFSCEGGSCEIATCRKSQLCNAGCPDDGYQCQSDCFWSTSKQARINQSELSACSDKQAIDDCTQKSNGKDQTDCYYEHCSQKRRDCGALGGVKSCTDASDCPRVQMECKEGTCVNTTCGKALSCIFDAARAGDSKGQFKCFVDTTPTAQKNLNRYFGCLNENSSPNSPCRPGSTCAQNNCNSELVGGTSCNASDAQPCDNTAMECKNSECVYTCSGDADCPGDTMSCSSNGKCVRKLYDLCGGMSP